MIKSNSSQWSPGVFSLLVGASFLLVNGVFTIVSNWGSISLNSVPILLTALLNIGLTVGFWLFGVNRDKQIKENLDRLKADASEIQSCLQEASIESQSLKTGVSQAFVQLEASTSSIEEISSMVTTNSGHASEANLISQKTRDWALRAESEMKTLSETMSSLLQKNSQVEEIINVIDDISFQTNLLALNAAVEAARAGEHGRGFAVVAEAVRSLAQKSASSAKEISVLIGDTVKAAKNSSEVAQKSQATLSEIVQNVKRISDLNQEIATACQEQSVGVSQVSQAMNLFEKGVQQNVLSTEKLHQFIESAFSGSPLEKAPVNSQRNELVRMKLVPHVSSVAAKAPLKEKQKVSPFASKVENKKEAKVIELNKSTKSRAQELIPFDEDLEPSRKVGTTDGF